MRPIHLPPILDNAVVIPRQLPLVPELQLYLMSDQYPTESLEREAYLRLMEQPPYWAFCWGGGQALARWIFDNPGLVAGKTFIDFGAGSGVAGIAAAVCGADKVLAVDIDLDSLQVARLNASLNGVALETAKTCDPEPETILLAADVGYEEGGFASVLQHLERGYPVIIAESRLRDLDVRFPSLTRLAQYQVRTFPDLDEAPMFDLVQIYAAL